MLYKLCASWLYFAGYFSLPVYGCWNMATIIIYIYIYIYIYIHTYHHHDDTQNTNSRISTQLVFKHTPPYSLCDIVRSWPWTFSQGVRLIASGSRLSRRTSYSEYIRNRACSWTPISFIAVSVVVSQITGNSTVLTGVQTDIRESIKASQALHWKRTFYHSLKMNQVIICRRGTLQVF